jgi:lysophospholipase L1-like esterase
MRSPKYLLPLLLSLLPVSSARANEFALRDGDTVVFLGDSITAARTYGKLVENYTLLRFPDRKLRFVNAGVGGDTAAGGLKRLERDVFSHKPTVVIVAYGVNDIGWGLKADDEHKKAYLEGVRGIVGACRKREVRVYICSAAVTAEDPAKSETGFLKKMCDEGMELSRSLGGHAIDVQGTMRGIQKTTWAANAKLPDKAKHDTLHATDGVHLNDLGQLAMAFAILKGLGAPADVSSVTIDADGAKLVAAKGCSVKDLASKDGALEFTRLDEGLPFNYGIFYALNYRFVPVPNELNRYLLAVKNLPKGSYEVNSDGRGVGVFTAEQLAGGVNIASTTTDAWQPGGPWNAQANVLKSLTDSRHEISSANTHLRVYLPTASATEQLGKQSGEFDDKIVEMQRTVAKPQPYRFVIKKHEPPAKKDGK